MLWESKDFEDAERFKSALASPESELNLFLQSLHVMRERYIKKGAMCEIQETPRLMGIIQGIDLAISEAPRMVKEFEKAREELETAATEAR